MQAGLAKATSNVAEGLKSSLEHASSVKAISRSSSAGTKEFLAALHSTAHGDFEGAKEQVGYLSGHDPHLICSQEPVLRQGRSYTAMARKALKLIPYIPYPLCGIFIQSES